MGQRRLADPALALPVRADAHGPGAEPPPAHLALEDSRQPQAQPRRASHRRPVPGGMDVPARQPGRLDTGRSGGAGVLTVVVAGRNPRRSEALATPGRAGARPCRRREDRVGACVAATDVRGIPGLPDDPRHRDHDRARGRHPSQDARVADGSDRGVSAGSGRAHRNTAVRDADAGKPAVRDRRAGGRVAAPAACPAGGPSDPAAVDSGAAARPLAQPTRRAAPAGDPGGRSPVSSTGGLADVALLRHICRRGSWIAAGQRPGGAGGGGRASDVADQHRHGPAFGAGGSRSPVHPDQRARRTCRCDADHGRGPGRL